MDFRRFISETARLSVFWERILRFSRAKILRFFLWLSAKNFKSAFRFCLCSRPLNHKISVLIIVFIKNSLILLNLMCANGENTQSASPGASGSVAGASLCSTAWRPQIGCFCSGSISNYKFRLMPLRKSLKS